MCTRVRAVEKVLLIDGVANDEEVLNTDAHKKKGEPRMEGRIVVSKHAKQPKASSECKSYGDDTS